MTSAWLPPPESLGQAPIWYKFSMTTTKKRETQRTAGKARPEPPWNVILHNDWDNSMLRVVYVLKKVIPRMSLKKATAIMYKAHTSGRT